MVQPGFSAEGDAGQVVLDVCRRLDGLPLAVELAAARLRALPLTTMAERLDDRFRLLTGGARTTLPRQQTLRAVVDWSYDLLFEDERRLFARLSVFAGGCELAAVEAVCADDQVPRDEILDILSRLIDKSFVTVDLSSNPARYSQLQTLWQYARERLADSATPTSPGTTCPLVPRPGARRDDPAYAATRESNGERGWRRNWTNSAPPSTGSSGAVTRPGRWPSWAASPTCGSCGLTSTRATGGQAMPSQWTTDGSTGLRGYAAAYQAFFWSLILGPAGALDSFQEAMADLRQARSPDLGGALLVLSDVLARAR